MLTGVATVTLSVALLVGCSGGEDDGRTKLELFSNKSESIDTYEALIEKFEEQNPEINIELNTPPEAETVLKTRLTKNDMPDLLSIGGNATYGELARAGVLNDFSDSEYIDKIQPAYLEMVGNLVGDEKEGQYGLPYATNVNTVIYNKDKFAELGLEVPTTWDEFKASLETIEEAGETPIYLTLKDAWTGMIPWNSIAANIQPEDFAAKMNSGETSFKESYPDVAEKMLTLLEFGHGDNFGVAYGDGNTAFAKGESVYYLQGNWAIPEIKNANADIDLGVFALPVTNDSKQNKLVSGVDVLLTMSEDTKHSEEAIKFIEFMIEEENAEKYINDQKSFSALEGVYQEDPTMEGIKVNFEEGRLTSFPDHYYPTGMQAANLIQEFLIDQKTDTFLEKIDKEWEKVQNR